MSSFPPSSALIIGAGVFGLTTAQTLSTRHPNLPIHILTTHELPPTPQTPTASNDISRIVRADYASHEYSSLATQALTLWRTTPHFHASGMVLVADGGDGEKYLSDSFKNVTATANAAAQVLSSPAAIGRVLCTGGSSGKFGYVNRDSGWVDAAAAMTALYESVRACRNVSFEVGTVEALVYSSDGDGAVVGARLVGGREVLAGMTVVAAGAWSPGLVPLAGRAVASGQVLGYLRVTEEEARRYRGMPVLFNLSSGVFVMPPPPPGAGGLFLKFGRHAHGYSAAVPSFPGWIPKEAERGLRIAVREMTPEFAERGFDKTRVCWYTDTPGGDFLVGYCPSHRGLFLATGGSGHAFKFLPVLGGIIGDIIEGKEAGGWAERWGWRDHKGDWAGDGSRGGSSGQRVELEVALRDGEKEKGLL